MKSYVHLIIGITGNPLQNIMRNLKRYASESLHKCILKNGIESRREWILWIASPDSKAFLDVKEQQRKIIMLQSFNYGNPEFIQYS